MRCIFQKPASSNNSYRLTELRQWVSKKTSVVSLTALIGIGGGFWLISEAIAPQPSKAETARVDVLVEREPDETFDTFLSRAKSAARNTVEINFSQNSEVTEVSSFVLGENQGTIAPVLSLKVSRSQWLRNSDLGEWATYFATARSLLQFEPKVAATPDQLNPTTPPTQPQPTNVQQDPSFVPNNTPTESLDPNQAVPNPTNTVDPNQQPGTTNPTNTVDPADQPPGIPTPTNTIDPNQQPGTTTPTNTTDPTPNPGTGLVPQPPTSAPVAPVSAPLSPTPPPNVNPSSPSSSTPNTQP